MPEFSYEALDTNGVEVKDSIEAGTQAEAITLAREKGHYVTRIVEGGNGEAFSNLKSRQRRQKFTFEKQKRFIKRRRMFLAAAVTGLIVCWLYCTYGTGESIKVVVRDKGHITTGSGESISGKYLVYCESETFENEDSLLWWKYNSSDIQGRLERGSSYRVYVCGIRIPFFSTYRNIVQIEAEL